MHERVAKPCLQGAPGSGIELLAPLAQLVWGWRPHTSKSTANRHGARRKIVLSGRLFQAQPSSNGADRIDPSSKSCSDAGVKLGDLLELVVWGATAFSTR